MILFREKLLVFFILCTTSLIVPSQCRYYAPPEVPRLTDLLPHVSFYQGFSKIFGGSNIQFGSNGSSAILVLDKISGNVLKIVASIEQGRFLRCNTNSASGFCSQGAGLVSKNVYQYGFFSAAIKLPSGFSSGVVVAFYLSNSDAYPHNHDEIDIELLGHDRRKDWVFQTNIYANGSVSTGREEKFYLWFDPTLDHHEYSIIWNNHHTVFLVDNIPVREYVHNVAFSFSYPTKPMSLIMTIWDGSQWATHGGKYPVNYKFAPYKASFTEMEMGGSIPDKTTSTSHSNANTSRLDPVEGPEFVKLSQQQMSALDWARRKLMFYSYCKDTARYKVLPPECK